MILEVAQSIEVLDRLTPSKLLGTVSQQLLPCFLEASSQPDSSQIAHEPSKHHVLEEMAPRLSWPC